MKFNCEGIYLSEAIMRVSKACAAQTTAPILSCVHFAAKNDTLTLTATDGEITIRKSIPAEILEEGEVCVPGRLLADFIKKLETESLSLQTTDGTLRIGYGESASVLQTLPADDFPGLDLDVQEDHFVMTRAAFKDLVAKTAFCCASDDSRPILKGCLVEISENAVTATALDGYRLATCKRSCVSASGNLRIICPARTLNEIARMIPDGDGELTVFVRSGMMMVKMEDTILTSKLYKGDFIDKNTLIPTRFETVVTVKKSALSESIERAAVMVKADRYSLVIFDIGQEQIGVTSASDLGNVRENVKAQTEGKELRIAMNSKYMLESMRAIDGETVRIGFNSAISPLVCTDADEADAVDLTYLILPVRTQG